MGFADILGTFSGAGSIAVTDKLLFNSIIGFRGIVDGVGCSTIVQGLAHAFAERTNKRVCVVDTSILYPTQYAFLCNPFDAEARATLKDWFSVEATIPERIIDTRYKRISLLGCYNRRLIDAFSSVDSIKLVDDTFDLLKDLFDVVLVDLSHEWSQVSMAAAVKCNKIFTVVDPSAKCVNNITQSLNNFASAAVPFRKFDECIVSRYTYKGVTGLDQVLSKNKLETVAVIPFSEAIYEAGNFGKSCWGLATPDYGVSEYNDAIDTILRSLVNQTPLEIIDMAEVEALEEAVANSPIKNKNKARRVEMRKREALLSEKTEEEKAEIARKRHENNEKAIQQHSVVGEEVSLFEDGVEDESYSEGIETLVDTDGRIDADADIDSIDFGTDTKPKKGFGLFKKGGDKS